MKKILIKINMALILLMILFANTLLLYGAMDYTTMLKEIIEQSQYGDAENVSFMGEVMNDGWIADVPYMIIRNDKLADIGTRYGGTIEIKDGSIIFKSNDGTESKKFNVGLSSNNSVTKYSNKDVYEDNVSPYLDINFRVRQAYKEEYGEEIDNKNYSMITFENAVFETLRNMNEGSMDNWLKEVSFSIQGNTSNIKINDDSNLISVTDKLLVNSRGRVIRESDNQNFSETSETQKVVS